MMDTMNDMKYDPTTVSRCGKDVSSIFINYGDHLKPVLCCEIPVRLISNTAMAL